MLCVQFDEEKILSGSADNTIKVSIFFLFFSVFQGGVLVFSEKSKVEYLREVNTLLFLFLTLK